MYFELEDRITFDNETDNRPKVSVFGENIKDTLKIGSFFYSQTNNKWAEGYFGLLFKPYKIFSIYTGMGVETDKNPYRIAIGSSLLLKKVSFIQWYEYGGSGFWYSIALNYRIKNCLKLGLLSKRYYGSGVNATYALKSLPLSINCAALYDAEFELFRSIISLRFTYN